MVKGELAAVAMRGIDKQRKTDRGQWWKFGEMNAATIYIRNNEFDYL